MYQRILSFTCCLLLVQLAAAQKGALRVQLLAEMPVPVYQQQGGWGGALKGYYPLGPRGELTFAAGIAKFRYKNTVEREQTITRLVPFLAGYRHNLGRWFVEPQAGYGEMGGKVDIGGDFARPSVGAFFWALGAGYTKGRLEAGLRFVSAKGAEGAAAGLWHDAAFHYTALHLGYQLFGARR